MKYTQQELGLSKITSTEEVTALTKIRLWRRHSLKDGIYCHLERPDELFRALVSYTKEFPGKIERVFFRMGRAIVQLQATLWYEEEKDSDSVHIQGDSGSDSRVGGPEGLRDGEEDLRANDGQDSPS